MSKDEDRSKREGRRWWLVLSLIAVVIISLLDAYDVLYHHLAGFQGDAWSTHPTWLKAAVHLLSLTYFVYLLRRRTATDVRNLRWTKRLVGLLLVSNICATTRRVIDFIPGSVEVYVLNFPVQKVYVFDMYDAMGLCYRSLSIGHWYMIVNGNFMIVPSLPAPLRDFGVERGLSQDNLCSRRMPNRPIADARLGFGLDVIRRSGEVRE